ncbi:MAG: hypothetical protein L0170_15425 [Acidobacteria bacterium]|nr:hypothetical protein [Acidobacteriota bacterium]
MPAKNEEYARSVPLLNKVFALSSLGFFIGTLWMVWDDYYRSWRPVQREFMALTAKHTEEELRQAEQSLNQEELKKIQEELQAVQARSEEKKKQLEALEEKQKRNTVLVYTTDTNFKNTKSVFDAVRFEYEELEHSHSPRAGKKMAELQEVQKKLADYKLANDKALTEQAELKKQREALVGDRAGLEMKRQDLLATVDRLQKKLAAVAPKGFVMRTFEYVRNAPLLDFMAPDLKVQQVVLDNQNKDINFVTIPRVDRCQTCHLGADQEGYENDPQPFTTHPQQEIYLASKSPHPVDKVGCTVCHRGLDRATDFLDAAHWPDSPEQQAQWVKSHDWHPKEHETSPMLPSRFIESSCLPCHQGAVHIPEARKWNHG